MKCIVSVKYMNVAHNVSLYNTVHYSIALDVICFKDESQNFCVQTSHTEGKSNLTIGTHHIFFGLQLKIKII